MKYTLIALLAMLIVPAVSQAKTHVSWGIGIGVSSGGYSGGGYYQSGGYYGPRYCGPPTVVYQPAPPPVYYAPPVYAPAPVYYAPAPVYYYAPPRTYIYGGYGNRYCR